MDFALDDRQLALQERIRNFATGELNHDLQARDAGQHFSRDLWALCAREGLTGLHVPVESGGSGHDPVSACAALEALGFACRDNGLWFAINAHLWGCVNPLLSFASAEQKQQFLPGLCAGTHIGALAVSEQQAGSDAFSLATRARRRGDDYVLDGRKIYITNGPVADVFLVLATLDPDQQARALTAFIVERGTTGAIIGGAVEKMGLRTAQMGELELRDCTVPAANRLGQEGAGVAIFTHAMEWERGMILAGAVGAMQHYLDRSRDFARTRRQFGRTIGKFQQVSAKIVDMQVRLDGARLLLYRFAWLKSRKRTAIREAAVAKLVISEAWVQSCLDMLQIHGGLGYLTDSGMERELRDAMASRLFSGTSEIQREVIANWLGL